ncbi:MAG TPA: phosphotransferase [Clostridiales bacterium]|nr:phosphotransferase [Clostridiales bacterium]
MLTKSKFDILYQVITQNKKLSQREISKRTSMALGKVNRLVKELINDGLLNEKYEITQSGYKAMEPYKVKNAIIMAAGMSSRFAPLSYEKPKALIKVKGVPLIERQISQLQEAGIADITLVVGYMKEKLFYLEDKFGVKIVVNEDYYRYNNTSTLMLVTDLLDNTYICSSDNYFTENPFEPYVYQAYYAAMYSPGPTNEYCLTCNKDGRITKVEIGGSAAWYMIGHVYFDREFSRKFAQILKREYELPETRNMLWEDVYAKYVDELDMYIRKYGDTIKEFDSLDELRVFDSDYIDNIDSDIFKNICTVLNCENRGITNIVPVKSGITNLSFRFDCKGQQYLYRHPGVGTEEYIDRKTEAEALQIAKELGLDGEFIYMDAGKGWKLSKYIPDAKKLDYHNPDEVKEALKMLRRLHDSNAAVEKKFDIWQKILEYSEKIKDSGRGDFADMAELKAQMEQLYNLLRLGEGKVSLCHGDSYDGNFLIDKNKKMYLIDWEYSGMGDPAFDIGTFIVCSDYSMKEAEEIIGIYLGHQPSADEKRRFFGFTALSAYFWFLWGLYQETLSKRIGTSLYTWYNYAKRFYKATIALYQ